MKYNKGQLVEMLIEDEKQYYDMSDEEWGMIEDEYTTELSKMGIEGANEFDVVGCGEEGDVIYNFGFDKEISVCGQGCIRRMMWA